VIDNKRRSPRLKHRASIRMTVPISSSIEVDMRDFSETGLFLFCKDEAMPSIGDIVDVQTTEFDDAPVQAAKVVRIEPGVGFAVDFISS
jgi:hypothetical protein